MKFHNQKYSDDILGKAKTTLISGFEWQDIAQELDIALWKNLEKFEGRNNASERTFALRVMRNKVIDLSRFADRQKRYLDNHHLLFSQLEETKQGQLQLECAVPVVGEFK